MLDIALLMANASQLKAVVEQGNDFAFFVPLVVLISISLVLQIGVGVLLIFLGRTHGCLRSPGMGRELCGGGWGSGFTSESWPSGSQAYGPRCGSPHLTLLFESRMRLGSSGSGRWVGAGEGEIGYLLPWVPVAP